MTRLTNVLAAAAAAALTTGCFTVSHTDYPQVQMSRAPADRRVSVALSGFEATLTSYVPVYGYSTAWRCSPGYYRHGRYHGGWLYPAPYSTTTYLPQTSETTAFVERAQDALEESGFASDQTNVDYRVEVKFSGPVVTDGDRTAQVLWWLCSALSADYGTQTWSAKLKIYDREGRLVFAHDYTEKYGAAVWGPVPIFSPAGSDQTDYNPMQCWCLNALTDRAMADATAFLSAR